MHLYMNTGTELIFHLDFSFFFNLNPRPSPIFPQALYLLYLTLIMRGPLGTSIHNSLFIEVI